ncbi:MAG: lipopolysaccharide heptosyltransferase II [Planctomycetales bacterium]|nr:lipopolysaccharide heptosyltransferase II [Planctomycetales bacterium]
MLPLAAGRIWIRVPNWVGDIVMATPALRGLRAAYPEARVALCGRPTARAILSASLRTHDEFHLWSRRSGVGGFWRAAKAARAFRPDLAILLTHSFGSALLARATGAARRLGYYTEGRSFLLTDGIPRPREGRRERPRYMADHYADLLGAIGVSVPDRAPVLEVPPEAQATADRLLAGHPQREGPVVVVNPGAAFGPSKCWPADRFAEAAGRLRDARGARIVVATAPGEEDVAEAVRAALPGPALHLGGASLPLDVLMGVIRRAALLVTNDTGPRHFAVAFGVPTVVLMGPTDPRYTATPAERGVVLRRDVPCGPCHLQRCPLPQGPQHHQCLTLIPAAECFEAASRWLTVAAAPAGPK